MRSSGRKGINDASSGRQSYCLFCSDWRKPMCFLEEDRLCGLDGTDCKRLLEAVDLKRIDSAHIGKAGCQLKMLLFCELCQQLGIDDQAVIREGALARGLQTVGKQLRGPG